MTEAVHIGAVIDKVMGRYHAASHVVDPVTEGEIAAAADVVVGDNPYPEESEAHFQWLQGWSRQKIKQARDYFMPKLAKEPTQ